MERFTVRGTLALGDRLRPGAVIVEDGRIVEVTRQQDDWALPAPILDSPIVAPGFIDLQVNGGFGIEVGSDFTALQNLAGTLPATGVTSWLPTVITSPALFYRELLGAFPATSQPTSGARILGLHLEGPFLSPARKGAHRAEWMEAVDESLFTELLASDALRLMTIAPELPASLDRIRRLRDRGIVVSLGHTNSTVAEFTAGIDAGATMATHLFNAMSPFGHREPGAIGAALTDDRVTVGLIGDGIHSHPAALRLALRAKGPDRIALVTDMMAAAGMPPGTYPLGDQLVTTDGVSARLPDGTLAGATLRMDAAVRNMVAWTGASPADAIRMATETPATILGRSDLGRLAAGNPADLTLLTEDLQVNMTLVNGRTVYQR